MDGFQVSILFDIRNITIRKALLQIYIAPMVPSAHYFYYKKKFQVASRSKGHQGNHLRTDKIQQDQDPIVLYIHARATLSEPLCKSVRLSAN